MSIRGKRATLKQVDPANPICKVITLRIPIPQFNFLVMEAEKSSKSMNQFLLDMVGKHEEDVKQQQSEC